MHRKSHEGRIILSNNRPLRIGGRLASGTFCDVFGCERCPEHEGAPPAMDPEAQSKMVIKVFDSSRQFRRTVLALAAIDDTNTTEEHAEARAHVEVITGMGSLTSFDDDTHEFSTVPYVLMPRFEMRLKDFVSQHVAAHEAGLPALASRTVARQLFMALDCLERADVVHGDIKPGNIMIRGTPEFDLAGVVNFDIVLCDFGSARICDSEMHKCHPASVGTTSFIAPEILLGNSYSFSADIWSAMATIFSIITGDTLFDVFNEDGLDYGVDMSGIAVVEEQETQSSSETSEESMDSSDDDAIACAGDDIDFPMLYAHIVLMYRLLGKPSEAFCCAAPLYYHNGVPRYSPNIVPGTILQFFGTNYHSLNRIQMRSIEEFLLLGLQYLEIDRHPAASILAHPFLAPALPMSEAMDSTPTPSASASTTTTTHKADRQKKKHRA